MNPPRTGGTTTDKEMITMAEEELARLHRQVNVRQQRLFLRLLHEQKHTISSFRKSRE